ncbi:4-hydroxy-tetrahydrodipicolinate reductase [Mycolicibacterium sp. BK634]|uniref:NAD(P)H-dependent amine dehydrogenase family protein n=1 Tax=Mycolicibacterium sp. BK634 TaxID=2587099 RepID=UPI001618C1E9|nr:4-hydroxy-tetrahydrodipicolinate reductase [Mycolicibacterium sp. BK634]
MSYKVIQWGTGNVGKHSLRAIIERPDLELVGLRVYSEEKSGRDAGDLVGLPPTGVRATTNVDEILAIDADCVAYTALGMTKGDISDSIADICLLLKNGFNVISSAVERAIYPKALAPDTLKQLEDACREGDSSFLGAGINPGFTMDLWPVYMSRLSRRIDRINIVEVCDMRNYDSAENMGFMGFGKTLEELGDRAMRFEGSDELTPFYSSVLMVSDALRFNVDAVRFESEYGVTDKRIEVATGVIEPGTVAVVKMRYVGESGGRDILVNEWVWRTTDEINPEWGTGEYWEMKIDGDPAMNCRLEATTTYDSKRIVSIVVATNVVNSIPAVCDASSGVKSALDLPPCGGGQVAAPAVANAT